MRGFAAPGALGVCVLLVAAYLSTAGSTPAGQPPLMHLERVDTLRADFNSAWATDRVVILLSQSCPYCLRGATEIDRVLARHRERPLAVFVVWQPILPTDWGRPMSRVLRRIDDPRVRQYWDGDRLVAQELHRSFERRDPQPGCCAHNGIWWDLMALFPQGAEWKDTFPEPLLLEGTVADAAPAFEALLSR